MKHTRGSRDRRPFSWAPMAGALAAALTFLAGPVIAGPKGTIVVRPLGNMQITIDGDISDWPLDKFTKASEQPPFPEGQDRASTTANGDHVVFDANRVGFFNGTLEGAFTASDTDFGASMYFAYDAQFLYILGVFIDDVLRDDRDPSEYGSQGYLNDGFEFFLDPKNDSTGCVATVEAATFDTTPPYEDDMQITVALNETFKPEGSADNVLGARQTAERAGNVDLIGADKGGPGGIYRDVLDALEGPDIAARRFDDLRAAGARNPELAARPTVRFPGYVIEMRVPFSTRIAGLTPDHPMGFELFWRDVDNGDTDPDSDPGVGGGGISWATWGQSTSVTCNGGSDEELKTGLFNASNWGTLVFDPANFLGPAPAAGPQGRR